MLRRGLRRADEALRPASRLAWAAYHALAGSRRAAYGAMMPIPVSEMMAWCAHYGVTDRMERQRLMRLVSAMDAHELARARNS